MEAALGLDVGIDARSLVKQSGPLLVSIEWQLRMYRYAAAVRGEDLAAALHAGAQLMNALRVRQRLAVTVSGERVPLAELSLPVPKVLLEDVGIAGTVQSLVVDLVAWRASLGLIDAAFIEALRSAAAAVFGSHDAIDIVLQAVARPASVDPNSARAIVLAGGIASSREEVEHHPAIRFRRDMMAATHLIHSFVRLSLGNTISSRLIEGWKFVGERQRFLLRNPPGNMRCIEAITSDSSRRTLADIAELLLVARYAVQHNFSEGWFENLRALREDNSTNPAG